MDLVFVTYNSEKWINQCFNSLLESDFVFKDLNVIVVDNNSNDKTVEYLEHYREKFSICGSYKILAESINYGFGKANNIAVRHGDSNIIVFVNIDTEFYYDTLRTLRQEINRSKDNIGLWELRQFPYEHPKKYNVISMETSWASGAAFAVRRDVFEQVGGFDENFFMYAEDVDFSWRVRAEGYKIKYIPRAAIRHYTYFEAYEVKPLQYCNSIINDLYLRYRYGDFKQIVIGNCRVIKHILQKPLYKGARMEILSKYIKHFRTAKSYKMQIEGKKEIAKFIGFDYEFQRLGAFYFHKKLDVEPEIAVILLNESLKDLDILLKCLENQTYAHIKWYYCFRKKIEIGDFNMAYMDLETKISDLDIPYFSFVDGNFLYYADHFETLISFMENNRKLGVKSHSNEEGIQESLAGVVFSTAMIKGLIRDICLNDIFSMKYNDIINQGIKCIDVETRAVWMH